MKRKWWVIFFLATLVAATAVSSLPAAAFQPAHMPPNEGKIAQSLLASGVIPPGATEDQIAQAVSDYIQLKLSVQDNEKPDNAEMAKRQKAVQERAVFKAEGPNLLRGKKLGLDSYPVDPASPQPWTGEIKQDKILILLVEFPDPPHNELPAPSPVNNTDFWTSDFSREHYQSMLFTPGGYTTPEGLTLKSMADYYLEQSGGSYTVAGDVYGWYMAPYPEAYYGDDNPAGGQDNLLPGTPKTLVKDVVALAAQAGVPFWEYDVEDPYDLDGDGDTNEPDAIVDHLMVIHAGAGQEAGGGVQGNDSIWSHSSSTWVKATDQANVPYYGGTIVYAYTIMPEDGAIGVFCHEFAHDLGLPDEYDTIYSGESSPAFWSLMASGSWLGQPLGTEPSSISPWGRMVLGSSLGGRWITPSRLKYADLTREGATFLLDQATTAGLNNQAVRIDLPPHLIYVNTPYGGSYEWWGGKGDEIDTVLTREVDLTGKTTAALDFWTWYDIEKNWDFGFVQASTDGGLTWTPLVTPTMTSDYDPDAMESIVANLPGYTGSSGDWIHESIDLTAYAGQNLMIQFRYMTDWATSLAGFFLDDIQVVADGQSLFLDNVETLDPAWIADGWTRTMGSELKSHYYLLEWRTHTGFDSSLAHVYNFVDYAAGIAQFLPYDPGLLVWYRDMAYTDNWVGVHPGHGFLLVVDAHPVPDRTPTQGLVWRTRMQIRDAAFGLDRCSDVELTYAGVTKVYQGQSAEPVFSDGRTYWYHTAPSNSANIIDYGISWRVLGDASDGSAAAVGIFLRQP